MAEYKAKRYIRVKKFFFVLHYQFGGVLIRLPLAFGIFHFSLAVLREIAVVNIVDIVGQQTAISGFGNLLPIYLFKPSGKLAFCRIAVCVILPVILNLVDEKQRKDFNAFALIKLFFFEMFFNGSAEHKLHYLVIHSALRFAYGKRQAIGEGNSAASCVNFINDKPLFVNLPLFAELINIITGIDSDKFLCNSFIRVAINLDFRRDFSFGCIYTLQLNECLIHGILAYYGVNLYLLHQSQIISLYRIEGIHQIVKVGVGGGIAKGAKGVEVFNRLFADVWFHIWRFINTSNRVGALKEFNGLFACELVIRLVDDVFVFGKGINVYNQYLNGIAGSKTS